LARGAGVAGRGGGARTAHPRRSPQELNDECLRLVCIACWGNSDDSFQQEAPPVASAGGEAAGAAVAAGNAAAVVPAKECEREAEDEACGVKMETEC